MLSSSVQIFTPKDLPRILNRLTNYMPRRFMYPVIYHPLPIYCCRTACDIWRNRYRNVGINPTRDGILRVCQAMGGSITIMNRRISGGEPVADLLVKPSSLHGTVIEGNIIPTLIDELPVIAVLAAYADGQTIIKDAAELKVKESNRIDTVVAILKQWVPTFPLRMTE